MRLGLLGLEEASLDNKPVKDNRPFVLVDKTTPVKTKNTVYIRCRQVDLQKRWPGWNMR